MKAVILAGGKGTRLLPYTTVIPKPLMPIGEKAILEVVIAQLKHAGIKDITLAVGYLAELIMAYFGNGSKHGVNIDYSREEKPLGTSGPLGKVKGLSDTFLVMNGDILTTLPYKELIAFHKKNKATVTIAVHKRDVNINFGVIGVDGSGKVTSYTEKPTHEYHVSMGINVMEPKVLDIIKEHEYLDFPELVKILIGKKEKVMAYVTDAYWLDIGRPDDYQKAIDEFQKMQSSFLP